MLQAVFIKSKQHLFLFLFCDHEKICFFEFAFGLDDNIRLLDIIALFSAVKTCQGCTFKSELPYVN